MPQAMTYQDTLRYLTSFYDYEKRPSAKIKFLKLDRTRKLAGLFGNPQYAYKTIHITGTKGKGSTSHFLSNILFEAGFKVGLYTSPHVSDLRERIRVNNAQIKKRELTHVIEGLKLNIKSLRGALRPSFFEVLTLAAFNYFKLKNVDFAVFEVGMGGRLDATNIIKPLACAITPVSYDHTGELGDALVDIAAEKAEIIKNGAMCVSAPQDRDVMKIIKDKCSKEKVPLFVVGREIKYKNAVCSSKGGVFDLEGILERYGSLRVPLLGTHQLVNGSVAVGLAEILISKGYRIPKASIYRGIRNTVLQARCEVVAHKPTTIIDAAHNTASARALKETIIENFKFNRLILILGISKDKDIKGICEELSPLADKIIITRANTPRAADPAYIKGFFIHKDAVLARNLLKAYNISTDYAHPDDIILVTGSFYLAGDARQLFEKSSMACV